MLQKEDCPIFVNFMICCFCQTFRYDDLKNQVLLFNSIVPESSRKLLKEEVIYMYQNYSWEDIKWFINKHCERRPKNKEHVDFIMQTIIDNLE